jgi:hypothetical protein
MKRYLAWLALAVWPAAAQQITGNISGSVKDHTGAIVSGAAVKLTSDTTGQTRETTSDKNGDFEFNAVVAGNYHVEITQTGFKKFEAPGIELTAGQSFAMGDLKLVLGDIATTVTVQAEGVIQIQTSSGERSGIITSEEIRDLTVINRDFSTLVALMPGVVDNPGTAEVQGFSGNASFNVNGGRSNGNSITIDGGSTENTNGGNGNNFVSLESVGAVRIVTSNYQAEFGRKPAASIMAITKSGGQQFHGNAYWYYRHEWMNANQFFNNLQGLPQTPRRVQTPGFTIGGPVFIRHVFNNNKSKLFFFAGLEFIHERRPQGIINLTTPTEAERTGDFSNSRNGLTKVYIKDPTLSGTCSGTNATACFPNNIIPLSRINPNGQVLLKLLPLPNGSIATNQYNYTTQESLNIPKQSTSEKIDYIINEKTTLWFKYNFWREDQQGWAVSAGNSNWGWMPSHYLNQSNAPVLSLTRIINPTLILEAAFRVTRWTENGAPLSQDSLNRITRSTAGFNVPQLYPGGNPLNLVPNSTFGGLPNAISTSLNARFPLRGAETPVFSDITLTKTFGVHTMKYGFYYERWKAVKGESGKWNGSYDFTVDSANPNDTQNPFANALLGVFKSYSESNTRPPLYENSTSYEWYAQDNWKINRKLTLDLGVRFGWSTPFYSPRRQEAGFVPSTWIAANAIHFISPVKINNVRQGQDPVSGALYPAILIGAIAPGSGNPYNGTVNLLTDPNYPHGLRDNSGVKAGPRFGFAYDPFGTGKTAIRGGFGMFYEMHEKDLWGYALHLDPPNQLSPTIYYGNFGSLQASQGFLFPGATSGLSADRKMNRTMSYSFGIQRQLPGGFVVDTSYVATLGRHLLERKDLNSIAAGTTLKASSLDPTNNNAALPTQFLYPYPGYTNIYYYNYDANSSYHSLQVSANRRFTKGLSGGLAWTWSKAMDYDDIDTTNISALVSPKIWNYGKAGYDRTHILKGSWVYQIPRVSHFLGDRKSTNWITRPVLDGWQMSGIMTLMSGAPLGVSLGTQSGNANNWSGSPTDAARPNVIANPVLPKDQRTFSLNVNPAAFALPLQGTFGDAPKDVFRGPGRNNFDVTLSKRFRLTERFKAEFRAEAYNIFNHTQFTSEDTTIRFNNTASVVKVTYLGQTYNVNPGEQIPTTFGQFTAAGLARRMQLALRIDF